jgi:hypothetical protein
MENVTWIQEFDRAINIFIGKIKGFRNVPEDQDVRSQNLKALMK